jgi:cation diffusion facilitator CzcD-associated flavoprotein CzcO
MSSENAQQQSTEARIGAGGNYDAVIVGAGFAGLCMLHRLRKLGLTARICEAGAGVGGTWFWNRYPGARVDIESLEYSYSFSDELQQEWKWSERYAPQAELLRYANHVCDRFDLRRDIDFNTRVSAAMFDQKSNQWNIDTSRGERLTARFCIMASGFLSAPKKIEYDGLDSFTGKVYYTSQWPHEEVDFTGKRVGIIGTGSSAIQSIPIIAQQAAHLYVFQRTANFSIPANNCRLDPGYERSIKDNYAEVRRMQRESFGGYVSVNFKATPPSTRRALEVTPEEREAEYESRWKSGGLCYYTAFADLLTSKEANDTAADFVRAKIRAKVRDPAVAELLVPKGFPFGTKRICADTNYYETYNRDNVTLVDIHAAPIEAITPKGMRVGGKEIELDAIIAATGFDAVTGALTRIDIRGRGGISLKQKWEKGPRTHLGLMSAGFPNLFTMAGPGSTSSLTNSIVATEQHTEWIADCIEHLRRHGRTSIEPTEEAEEGWVKLVNDVADQTLFPLANSWYMGANVPGKPRVSLSYLGGFNDYSQKCRAVAASGYQGFVLSA